ncbi:MAG: hypothetical protein KAW66_14695 [Candidatus Lokiarchaeota archaeon]|nr:hypothetical protein [Candidatus Lokiarchaeota archaeon]
MRLGKKILLNPRCESCGKRIYRIHSRFKNYNWREIPSHCPRCGTQISSDRIEHLVKHDELRYLLSCSLCIIVFIFIIVILAIFGR